MRCPARRVLHLRRRGQVARAADARHQFAMATGMGGGFACFALLALLKGGITRLRQ